MAIMALKIDRF